MREYKVGDKIKLTFEVIRIGANLNPILGVKYTHKDSEGAPKGDDSSLVTYVWSSDPTIEYVKPPYKLQVGDVYRPNNVYINCTVIAITEEAVMLVWENSDGMHYFAHQRSHFPDKYELVKGVDDDDA